MSCSIPANPDISGTGVRVAIYVQNLLSFVPAFYALANDLNVDEQELKTTKDISITILVTAFSILISAIAQALSHGLSAFHLSVILNLSWMNNTNTFIYFVLWVHHRTYAAKKGRIPPTWAAWKKHIRGMVIRESALHDRRGWKRMPSFIVNNMVIILGSLHLTVMAAVGIWLWSSPAHFENSQDPGTLIPAGFTTIPFDCTDIYILGRGVAMSSSSLRIWSILAYSFFLVPGLNLIMPAALFLVLYVSTGRFVLFVMFGKSELTRKERASIPAGVHPILGIPPVCIGLLLLLTVNVIFLVDNELTIHRARNHQHGESEWTFGQTLALLLLSLPLRDTAMLELYKRNSGHERLFGAVESNNLGLVATIVQADEVDLNKSKNLQGESPLVVAARSGHERVVEFMLDHNADINGVTSLGTSPLHAAAEGDHQGIVLTLLNRGANINSVDLGGNTPLNGAVNEGCESAARLLLEHGADCRIADINDLAPLHTAAIRGSAPMVQLLLDHGADVSAVDRDGDTPLDLAQGEDVKQLLRNKMTTPPSRDEHVV